MNDPRFAIVGMLVLTDASGRFAIEKLPQRDYVVEAWHERYGSHEISVSVGQDDTQHINFSFGAE